MSHHLDLPIARQDVRLDITDLYLFKGETGTVFAINVCHSIAGPIPVPGYHPEGMYEFKIDLNGDAVEDVTYRITFDARDAAGKQRFVLRRITGSDAADPKAHRQRCGSRHHRRNGRDPKRSALLGRQGRRPVLDRAGRAARGRPCLPGWHQDRSVRMESGKAKNLFAGHTVYSMVLEVPDAELLGAARSKRIGVWAVATLATDAGGWRPINRVGLPMIHPLFTQFNEDLGNRLNAGRPADDFATYGAGVGKAIAGVVAANGTSDDPQGYGAKVAHRFFPNVLPYEVGTPAAFGFVEWNGRSLIDNAPDVMFSIAANTPVRLGIGKELSDGEALEELPVCAFRGLSA